MNSIGDEKSTGFESPAPLRLGLFDSHQTLLHEELDTLRGLQRIRALEGESLWDLSMVNPDLAPPRPILDRLLESVTKTTTHRYAVSRGVRRLREAFSTKYQNRFGHALNPETQVCVCLGSKDATFHALRALIQPGDSVIVSLPAYPAHPSAVALAGGIPIGWEASDASELAAATLEKLILQHKATVLLVNFPSNPVGSTVSRQWWKSVGCVCARLGVTILNDFVYGEMCFSGLPAASALGAVSEGARTVEVYSLSKAYSVPGWRVGALVGDEQVVGAVSRLKSQADYGLFLPLQYAAALALSSDQDLVRPTVQVYERRLKVLRSGLEEIGWRISLPEAGACLWAHFPNGFPNVKGVSSFSSINVARHLLERGGVVVTPGVIFGRSCDKSVRFAAVMNEERLREVIRVIREVS